MLLEQLRYLPTENKKELVDIRAFNLLSIDAHKADSLLLPIRKTVSIVGGERLFYSKINDQENLSIIFYEWHHYIGSGLGVWSVRYNLDNIVDEKVVSKITNSLLKKGGDVHYCEPANIKYWYICYNER